MVSGFKRISRLLLFLLSRKKKKKLIIERICIQGVFPHQEKVSSKSGTISTPRAYEGAFYVASLTAITGFLLHRTISIIKSWMHLKSLTRKFIFFYSFCCLSHPTYQTYIIRYTALQNTPDYKLAALTFS